MTNDCAVLAANLGELSPVTRVPLDIANDTSLRDGADRQHVANGDLRLAAVVQRLARVDALWKMMEEAIARESSQQTAAARRMKTLWQGNTA